MKGYQESFDYALIKTNIEIPLKYTFILSFVFLRDSINNLEIVGDELMAMTVKFSWGRLSQLDDRPHIGVSLTARLN